MNIELIAIGKTDSQQIAELTDLYKNRINRYVKFTITIIPDIKNTKSLSQNQQKQLEGEAILKRISTSDNVILLDEHGEEFSSKSFANFLERTLATCRNKICFIIGGPYGFSDDIYKRANTKISISRMTFSHQIIRVIFAEQLYRAFTIINNEPYHHE